MLMKKQFNQFIYPVLDHNTRIVAFGLIREEYNGLKIQKICRSSLRPIVNLLQIENLCIMRYGKYLNALANIFNSAILLIGFQQQILWHPAAYILNPSAYILNHQEPQQQLC